MNLGMLRSVASFVKEFDLAPISINKAFELYQAYQAAKADITTESPVTYV